MPSLLMQMLILRTLRSILKNGSKAQALLQNKKRAGRSALLKNCVDPIFPKIGFDLD
jgi:hypothetical protein